MSSKISVSADACGGRTGTQPQPVYRQRIFAEEFRVVRIDPTLGRYVTRLNQFYEQIQRVGNNYNQIVRAVNTHFSHTAIPRQVLLLERRTRELKALPSRSSRSAANFTSYGRADNLRGHTDGCSLLQQG